MKVNGDEFLRNIEKQQARNNSSSHLQDNLRNYYNNINENPINNDNQELDDIRLNQNNNNKQKYILFGLSLVLLFLVTILTLRLLSEDKTKNNFTDNNLINEDKQLDVETKYNDTKEIVKPYIANTKTLDINKIEQDEENIKVPKNEITTVEKKPISDVFGLEKEQNDVETITTETKETITPKIETKKIVQEIVKKAEPKPIAKETIVESKKESTTTNVNGIYIQVGAFTKSPDQVLLNKLKKNNFKYIMHKMDVKGTLYTKVLVGSYPSRVVAMEDLSKIKSNINKNAYILRIK